MASGNQVQEILREAAVPASRPIDHARRIGTAFFLGAIGGTMLGLVTLSALPSLSKVVIGLAGLLAVGAVCLSPWLAISGRGKDSIPVVARVLGTKETIGVRRARGGGVIVPVVCRPCDVEGDNPEAAQSRVQDFRAVFVVHTLDEDKNPVDPPVGTLLPLVQVEAGMGELVGMADEEVTDAQRELMESLTAHPKMLRNKAPVMPLRRGALERVPGWAALEFWLASLAGAIVCAWGASSFFA